MNSNTNKIKVLLNGSINGIDADKIFNPSLFNKKVRIEMRNKYKIPEDSLVIGFVGRVVRDKGIIELINAWEVLYKEEGNVHLLIVGPFETHDPLPQKLQKRLLKDPFIHVVGFVNSTSSFYSIMDILVLPSYREGFGLVAIEAASMKLPVIATNIPGCIDAVQDGITGTLVPPYNVLSLTKVIRMYIKDVALRKKHGQAGRKRVIREFQQQKMWEALHEEYLRLI